MNISRTHKNPVSVEKNPTSPLIEKIQIKTKQLTKTEKLSGITAEGVGELELEAAGNRNLQKTCLQFITQALDMLISFDVAMLFPEIYPKK